MIITIDGPAASGKGTLAFALSKKYQFAYFDTGMIYRAVGLKAVLEGIDPTDEQKVLEIAKAMTFEKMMELSSHPDFRSDIGGQSASKVSAITSVRSALLKMQQDFALSPVFADGTKAKGVIYDGRDTGTVVCPGADIKLFMVASPEVRALRRFKEFQAKGIETTYEKVFEDMKERDKRDCQRQTAPMKPAKDAIIIDTSDMDPKAEIDYVVDLIEKRLK